MRSHKSPDPSKKEEKIIAYLEKFAKDHGIEYKKDKVGNNRHVQACYPLATKTVSSSSCRVTSTWYARRTLVPCTTSTTTPIRTIIDGEWLHADGTTPRC